MLIWDFIVSSVRLVSLLTESDLRVPGQDEKDTFSFAMLLYFGFCCVGKDSTVIMTASHLSDK